MNSETLQTEVPTRFEDEYPEEAEILATLCANKKLRERVQWEQSSYPKSERIYPNVKDIQLGILGWKHMMFNSTKTTPYKRTNPKINRNSPCSCGSGKKYKKCCFNA
jgi:uncharacterized protein YecA (UPF0149 family)